MPHAHAAVSSEPATPASRGPLVLGVHMGHDSAAALLEDGEVLFAIAEERISRRKHDQRFPLNAIKLALSECRVSLDQLAAIAVTPTEGTVDGIPPLLKILLRSAGATACPISVVGHHMAHAASAYFPSGFDDALVFTSDGRGGLTDEGMETYCLFHATRGEDGVYDLRAVWRQSDCTFSFGGFYGAIATCALGASDTDFLENAGKGMGLAPYGMPGQIVAPGWNEDAITAGIRAFAHIDPEDGTILVDGAALAYGVDLSGYRDRAWQAVMRAVCSLVPLEPQDARLPKMCMYFAQRWFEHALLTIIAHWTARLSVSQVCLAGGCALNSVANTLVAQLPGMQGLFVQPACGDTGTALGAAYLVSRRTVGTPRPQPQVSDALGKEWRDSEIRMRLRAAGARFEKCVDPALRAAELLAQGKIVGWFQGRDEFGPRALGQRSILADPRHASMKDQLNARVKFREGFRPFAPITTEEAAPDWFEVDRSPAWTPLDFMLVVPQVRPERAASIAAAAHIDGSGRLQRVRRDVHPLFHRLLQHFGELTSVPVLINTSFNLKGQPIVHTPEDAYRCFVESKIDALFIGSFVVTEKPAEAETLFESARLAEALHRARRRTDLEELRRIVASELFAQITSREESLEDAVHALSVTGKVEQALELARRGLDRHPDRVALARFLYTSADKDGREALRAAYIEAMIRGIPREQDLYDLVLELKETGRHNELRELMHRVLSAWPGYSKMLPMIKIASHEVLAGCPAGDLILAVCRWLRRGDSNVSFVFDSLAAASKPEAVLAIGEYLERRHGAAALGDEGARMLEELRSKGVKPASTLTMWLEQGMAHVMDR